MNNEQINLQRTPDEVRGFIMELIKKAEIEKDAVIIQDLQKIYSGVKDDASVENLQKQLRLANATFSGI